MLKAIILFLWSFIFFSGIMACKSTLFNPSTQDYYTLPSNFPSIVHPAQNAPTALRVELGRMLFYDPILSRDSTISCANCHKQQFAFADSLSFSLGVEQRKGTQNAPSLVNIGYASSFTRAGGVPTLEMQILVPIQEAHEFDFNIVLAGKRVSNDSLYKAMSLAAYERTPDPYVITRSIAAFERTLVSAHSPYDLYIYNKQKNALSPSAKRGLKLFMSDQTNCSSCHTPPHFSDFSFKNNGLYTHYADSGRIRLTYQEKDRALFKVPSLRNVGISGPYMHDGSIHNLEQIIQHYNKGGQAHKHKSPLIRPLHLSLKEQKDLLAFLKSLTDQQLLKNPSFSNPHL
ncbi:MAG: cytochrome c peroxidase [Aureispira sp.]|jgi:cytochrome c peroxidase